MANVFSEFDRLAMQRALALAARGLRSTDPNPRVGCVIAQDEQIVAEGWHKRAGEAHAEVIALSEAGERAAGASVYVTLEPCSHEGRTPPCVAALIEARVARVVYAIDDPNPQVNGAGAQALREAGIAVEAGLLESEAWELNVGFLKRMRSARPWLRLKLAMSLDGRTALLNGQSQWLTGEAAREDVQLWRARSSALLTGVGTLLADDPRLDVRLAGEQEGEGARQPLRVVLDTELRTPPGARLFSTGGEVLILTAAQALLEARASALTARGAHIESLPTVGERILLPAVLDRLTELEINEVQIEAGPTLASALLRQSLVDEVLLYIAPKLLGDQAQPLVELDELQELKNALTFTLIGTRQFGDDVRLQLRPSGTEPR